MLCQTYEGDLIPHRTVAEMAGTAHLIPSASYNEDILGADGFECIDRVDGIYFAADEGALADSGALVVTGWTRQRWWPGWGRYRWEFDAETGAFLRRADTPGSYYAQDVYQGAGGELWLLLVTGPLQLLGPDYQPSGTQLLPATYGAITFRAVLVDRMRNRIVMTRDTAITIEVRALDTGTLLHTIIPPSRPRDICHEEGSRCYVLTETRDVLLLDYMTGRWMGAVKLTGISGANARIAWDKRYRRLAAIEQPAAPIGYTNQVGAVGFSMRPVATHLCTPIPLKRLRAGESVPVLVKAVGDMGEGIPSAVSVSVVGPALSSPRNVVALDGAGEGVAVVDAVSAGSDTLSLSMDIPCQL
ncbi:hypothetical protein U5817_10035 [Aromatoleum evansii]|uniref:Uncharacterized protein n=1 Tax=Aromatoleum evansii TaxID=59406 RepID=A0ABZ1ATQ8_AROEV|nr:hypothetical protein U5817_09685 [Aromatoleum evansii]WRL48366.1 hypothetical protein U5817_10035 [Aromatoleum evansii]